LFVLLGIEPSQNQEAIESFDKAIEIDPNDASTWCNKGTALSNLGKNQEAIESFDKASELNPNLTVAQEHEDLAHKQSGRKIKYYTSDGKPVYE
jgi:tetratricopeptide (TPR) repeat protein